MKPIKNVLLFDEPTVRQSLLPFTFTRPVSSIRIGIDTIAEKWERQLNCITSFITLPYLEKKFTNTFTADNIYINGCYCPNKILTEEINNLGNESVLKNDENIIAIRTSKQLSFPIKINFEDFKINLTSSNPVSIRQLVDIFIYNGKQLHADFQDITRGLSSQKVKDSFTVLYNPESIFIEENANIKGAILDATNGPIYIGKNAEIQIGSLIQGPFALGENSTVSLGSKIRSNTTIGPNCKVGGEISKSVIFGNSNKAHDGYMGCAVVGEWCNWGAATNNSNLKNDYGKVKLYNYTSNSFETTTEQFVGTFMGDYSKTAIGTLFNTGTIVGVCDNIFYNDFLPKHIPSFSWGGGANNSVTYNFEKAIAVINATMQRRGLSLTVEEIEILKNIYTQQWGNQ
jgi:UDP-N-acetylglucosamine diphosphorylase / glucose-1-phosphate thymidylyltransferase / UDP-N-acetylgalactosamine diphosphorylase / glucosamine-1-phosphate N-acetyltransferase / galactosamine-1-phosphate N-acetyltransferase